MTLKFNGYKGIIFLRFKLNNNKKLDECQIWVCDYSMECEWGRSVKRLDCLKMGPMMKKRKKKEGLKNGCFKSYGFWQITYIYIYARTHNGDPMWWGPPAGLNGDGVRGIKRSSSGPPMYKKPASFDSPNHFINNPQL